MNLDECNKIWKKKKKEVTIGSSSFKGPSTVHHKEVEAYITQTAAMVSDKSGNKTPSLTDIIMEGPNRN